MIGSLDLERMAQNAGSEMSESLLATMVFSAPIWAIYCGGFVRLAVSRNF